MKRIPLIAAALIFGLCLVFPAGRAEARTFSGVATTLMGVDFVDARNGWAVGGAGVIYHTDDGGKHWKLQAWDYTRSGILRDVKFVDSQRGWAVGTIPDDQNQTMLSVIIHTSDAGKRWDIQAGLPQIQELSGADFTDPNNGWVVGQAKPNGEVILHTSDGGLTWTTQMKGSRGYRLFDVDFVDPDTGWAVGTEGAIWHTSNGGSSWSLQSNPLSYIGGPMLKGVHFSDSQHGWAVSGFGHIIHTDDGGNNWTIQNAGSGLESVDSVGEDNAWAVGGSGAILHTVNSGSNWQTQGSQLEVVTDVKFIDSDEGWAVGGIFVQDRSMPTVRNGKTGIIHTQDGGEVWTLQFFLEK